MTETALIDKPQPMRGGPMKFAYASGARPLEGYTIKRGIGVGGFGEVYFATSDAGKEVALKRIQRNLDVELRGVSQCLNLKHVNLISLFDIKYDDHGQGWVVMEYVSGECLKDVIERNPNGMPRDEAHEWFAGIAAGVAYLHDHGIVHRDLKPGNIFADDRVVKIGDYGLSKFISCSRRSGQTESVGTFHYMAPEIGKGVYGKEIDIYALGIILFEMLTGRVPFEGESSQEIIMKHLTDDPDLSGIGQPYERIIAKALAKDPDHRYSTVAEMNAALQSGSDDGLVMLEAAKRAAPAPVVVPVLREFPESIVRADQPARAVVSPDTGTLYISDEEPQAEILFGPVKHKKPPVVGGPAYVPSQRLPVRQAAYAPRAVQTNEEPIAKAVRSGWTNVSDWLNNGNVGVTIKVIVLIILGGTLLLNANWVLPAAVVLGTMYLVYYAIRALVLALTDKGPAAPAASATTRVASPGRRSGQAAAVQGKKSKRRSRYLAARELLGRKSSSEKMTELTGSLLMSALVSGVLSLLLLIVTGKPFDASVNTWSHYGWLMMCGTLGAWLVLALSKFWEGREGEPFRRRFVMLGVGMAAGAAFFGAEKLLMVKLADTTTLVSTGAANEFNGWHMLPSLYSAEGTPLVGAYLAYFAGLFLVLRWWKQADPLRASRVSLWATGACVLWAYLLDMFWQFPQPWGVLLAAVISLSVQLSAPWMNPKERSRASEQVLEA